MTNINFENVFDIRDLTTKHEGELIGNTFYYEYDNWNDFGYHCLYRIAYCFPDNYKHVGYDKIFNIGVVRIAFKDQLKHKKNDLIREMINGEKEGLLSYGSKTYYENIIKLENMGLINSNDFFDFMHDIAYNINFATESFPEYNSPEDMYWSRPYGRTNQPFENPLNNSLLRDESAADEYIRNSKIANRKSYFPDYIIKINNDLVEDDIELRPRKSLADEVLNKSVYCIIGKNGVGKSTLLKKIYNDFNKSNIIFSNQDGVIQQSKIYFVSLSPFEAALAESENKKYFGLQMQQEALSQDIYNLLSDNLKKKFGPDFQISEDSSYVSKDIFFNRFITSITDICFKNNSDRWIILLNKIVPSWARYEDVFDKSQRVFLKAKENEYNSIGEYFSRQPTGINLENDKKAIKDFYDNLYSLMYSQSSGISFIILVLTFIFSTISENSIILFDEPENHLHPPMLSSLIDAVSWVCNDTNSVALIATHSPVVVQQLTRQNVFILENNSDNEFKISHTNPTINTFGENIGKLNRIIFAYEIDKSGYYGRIKEYYTQLDRNQEIINVLLENSGIEGKALISEREVFFDKDK